MADIKKRHVVSYEKMSAHPDLAAAFQKAVVSQLCERTMALVDEKKYKKLAIAGGVASNSALREALMKACKERGVDFYAPRPVLCTDNAAMIAIAGYFRYLAGERTPLDVAPVSRLADY